MMELCFLLFFLYLLMMFQEPVVVTNSNRLSALFIAEGEFLDEELCVL